MAFLTREDKNELMQQIAGMRGDIKGLRAEREAVREELDLADEIVELKRKIEDLKISEDRLTEKHKRERREVEHDVGLLRKRQEFEVESATRETELTVREENLAADKERFKGEMDFQRTELSKQIDYLKDLMEKVMERLPSASMTLRGTLADVGAGSGRDNGNHE